jgi:hypothetical protein
MASHDTFRLLPSAAKMQSIIECEPLHEQKTEAEHAPRTPWYSTFFLLFILSSSLLLPPILLAVWWSRWYRPQRLQLWRSAPIGGEFDQMSAKTIDFIAGALLAPLVMAVINLIWFRYARIAASNELSKDQKGTQLVSLLEMSVTSGGTYDPWKLWSLLRASRSRLSLMAALALLSAISTSLFVNIIAYEAVSKSRSFDKNVHGFLNRLPSIEAGLNLPTKWGATVGNWTRADSTAVLETTSTLHQISYGHAQAGSGQG